MQQQFDLFALKIKREEYKKYHSDPGRIYNRPITNLRNIKKRGSRHLGTQSNDHTTTIGLQHAGFLNVEFPFVRKKLTSIQKEILHRQKHIVLRVTPRKRIRNTSPNVESKSVNRKREDPLRYTYNTTDRETNNQMLV